MNTTKSIDNDDHGRFAALPDHLKEIYLKAKSQAAFHAVDTTHLQPDERKKLAEAGLSFTADRKRRVIAMYPQRMREADLREKVTGKRYEVAVETRNFDNPNHDPHSGEFTSGNFTSTDPGDAA